MLPRTTERIGREPAPADRDHLVLRSGYDVARMRRRSPAVALLLAVLATVLVPLNEPAGAASVDQLRRERREIQQRRAAQASTIDVLQAQTSQLTDALDALEEDRRNKEAEAAAARQRADAHAARAAEAKAAQERTTAELDELRGEVRRLAIDEYIRGGAPELDIETDLTEPMETARRGALLNAAMGRSADITSRLRQVEEDLRLEREAAERAAEAAAVERQRAEQALTDLEARVADQERVAAEAETRLERSLAEAGALASLDSTLANRIAAEQAALARRLRGAPGRSSGRTSASTRVGNVSVTTVRGITVATHIADNLEALLDAAAAAGIIMSGGGYRDSSGQIATRRNNCGTSNYDIYEKPASSCSPPTARPGQSMHERGEAVDFTQGGSTLTSSSSGYRWLKSNAARFGFYNLPGEPWHWSTNGN